MLELLEKVILAGVGLANLTKEKAEAIVDSLIAKGQIEAKDKKAVLHRLLKGTAELDRQLEDRIKDVSLSVVKNSYKQIDVLNKKLAKLAKDLEAAKKKSTGTQAKKKKKKA
ncbi:MAG: hypothetical protein PHO30_09230 [Candidatus Omnitrophica bacterium]|nr:hypothetical protein [Candidatus Omnitrophota bacterium]